MNRICFVTCLQAVRATTSAMRQRLSVPIICSTNTGTCPQRPFLRICCHALSMTFTKQLPIIIETKTVQFRIRRLSLRCRKVRVSTWRSIFNKLLFLEKKNKQVFTTRRMKTTGSIGFPKSAFRGCEPVVFKHSIYKEIPLKRTKRGKSGERFYPVRARSFQSP